MKLLRLVYLGGLLACPFALRAQSTDTLQLKEVTVLGMSPTQYLEGATLRKLDSTRLENAWGRHLGEVLATQMPVYFRTYGNGMLAGISLRGTSPQQTAVLWNGVSLQNLSHGQVDFSLMPAMAFGEVEVVAGGGSSLFGSGAIGGAVLLGSPNYSGPMLRLTQSVESFGRYQSSLHVATEHAGVQWLSTLYHHQAENNFPIPGSQLRQPHAAFRQYGMVQHMHTKGPGGYALEVDYWYHWADREIQPVEGSTGPGDTQRDASHRLIASLQKKENTHATTFRLGYVHDLLAFNGPRGVVGRWLAQTSLERPWWGGNLHLQGEWNHLTGRIPEYGTPPPTEQRADLALAYRRGWGQSFDVSFNLRQPFVSGFSSPMLPYLGARWTPWQRVGRSLSVRGNVARNFRAPTLNDRYWPEVGRLDLRPEVSLGAEGGLVLAIKNHTLEALRFWQRVDDWIQWTPIGNRWTPENLRQVVAEGWEIRGVSNFQWAGMRMHTVLGYQFTQSLITRAAPYEQQLIGKQLMYTPLHSGNASWQASWKGWGVDTHWQYAGKRYTNTDNSELFALPGFMVGDVSVSRRWPLCKARTQASFQIRNVLNHRYQLYAGRALPGRHYALQIQFLLNTPSKKP
jgi:vitamin B12 transporter